MNNQPYPYETKIYVNIQEKIMQYIKKKLFLNQVLIFLIYEKRQLLVYY